MLHTLLKWILLGTSNHAENETRRKGVGRSISVACQYIIQSTKTLRQVNYKPQENVTPNRGISCTVETPLYVWTSISIHQKTTCRELINILSDLSISINYDKLQNIESQLSDSVLTEINNNEGAYIPKSISKDLPIYFAINNTDLKIDIPDGWNQLHRTAIAVYKKNKTKKLKKFYNTHLLTAKVNETHQADLYYPVCPKLIRKNNNYSIYTNHLSSKVMRICRNDDIVWNLVKTLYNGLAEKIPTCSAYNSISVTKSQPKHIVFYQLSKALLQIGQICTWQLQHLLN